MCCVIHSSVIESSVMCVDVRYGMVVVFLVFLLSLLQLSAITDDGSYDNFQLLPVTCELCANLEKKMLVKTVVLVLSTPILLDSDVKGRNRLRQ